MGVPVAPVGGTPQGKEEPQQPVPYDRFRAQVSKVREGQDRVSQLEAENRELRAKAAQAEQQVRIQAFLDGTDVPAEFATWEPERQERWRTARMLELARGPAVEGAPPTGAGQVPQPQVGLSEAEQVRLEVIELRQAFGQLTDEQIAALRTVRQSRNPQNERELLMLAQLNYPQLFGQSDGAPPAGQQGLPPGRGDHVPMGRREPSALDFGSALDQSRGDLRATDRLGVGMLDALARENPGLLFNGR
jgi:hypothetical protein